IWVRPWSDPGPTPVRPRSDPSACLAREGVARVEGAGAEAATEPFGTLRRRAVGKAIGRDAAGRHALQPIVADRGGRLQSFIDVAGLELHLTTIGAAGLRRSVSPDAGQAVGLQLEAHRQRIRGGRLLLLRGSEALLDAGQPLHVMADLVRDDVGAREIAGRAESLAQLAEESQIQVDAAVRWTVERTGRRLRQAARRLNRIAEQHDAGRLVAAAQRAAPEILNVLHDRVDEVDLALLRW